MLSRLWAFDCKLETWLESFNQAVPYNCTFCQSIGYFSSVIAKILLEIFDPFVICFFLLTPKILS